MVTGFVLTCSSGLVSNVVLVGWVVEASGLLVVSEANSACFLLLELGVEVVMMMVGCGCWIL